MLFAVSPSASVDKMALRESFISGASTADWLTRRTYDAEVPRSVAKNGRSAEMGQSRGEDLRNSRIDNNF